MLKTQLPTKELQVSKIISAPDFSSFCILTSNKISGANAILDIINNYNDYAKISQNALIEAIKYDWKIVVEDLTHFTK